MKKTRGYRKILAAAAVCGLLAGCAPGQQETSVPAKPAGEEPVSPTPTATAVPSPTFTPTPSAVPLSEPVKYETEDERMILYLPDDSWENVSDEDGIRLFESEDMGKISILHGTREELKDFTIPDSEKRVEEFYQDNGVSGRDFQILEYVDNSIGTVGIYRYTVKFQEDSGFSYVYSANYVVVAGEEIYSVCGTVLREDEDLLARVRDSVESLRICQTDAMAEADGEPEQEDSDEGSAKSSEDYSEDPQFVEEEQGGNS